MSKSTIQVITSVQRRQRWSAVEKQQLVSASLEPARAHRPLRARPAFIQASMAGADSSP
jgi:hypothetical protein